jgi:hypothetical protein
VVAVWANTGDAMVANAIAATQASFDLLVIVLSIELREFVKFQSPNKYGQTER